MQDAMWKMQDAMWNCCCMWLAVCVFFVHTHKSRTQPWRALWIVRWTTRAVVAGWARRKRGRPGGARYWNEDLIAWPSLPGKSSPFLRPHLLRNHETFWPQLERAILASSPFRAQSLDLLVSGSSFFFSESLIFGKSLTERYPFLKHILNEILDLYFSCSLEMELHAEESIREIVQHPLWT